MQGSKYCNSCSTTAFSKTLEKYVELEMVQLFWSILVHSRLLDLRLLWWQKLLTNCGAVQCMGAVMSINPDWKSRWGNDGNLYVHRFPVSECNQWSIKMRHDISGRPDRKWMAILRWPQLVWLGLDSNYPNGCNVYALCTNVFKLVQPVDKLAHHHVWPCASGILPMDVQTTCHDQLPVICIMCFHRELRIPG